MTLLELHNDILLLEERIALESHRLQLQYNNGLTRSADKTEDLIHILENRLDNMEEEFDHRMNHEAFTC